MLPSPTRLAKLAGLGAFGACAGIVAIYAALVYFTRHTAQGGILPVLSWLTWISCGVVVVLLIGAHVFIGKQLMHIGNGGGPTEV